MGDGTEQNPHTRDDVLKAIEQSGGTAEGLDLSEKWFEKGINLSKLDLRGIILKKAVLREAHLEGADLGVAHLEGAYLREAHLEGTDLREAYLEGAYLPNAHLEGAYLWFAHLEGADLWFAHLEGAGLIHANLEGADLRSAHLEGDYLGGAKFSPETKLENVDWGNYILGEEKSGTLSAAADIYRRLKIWYTNAGMYDTAGRFFYREMEAKRKERSWKKPHLKLWGWVLKLLCGYGEKPERVVVSALVVIFGSAIAYYLWGSFNTFSFWDTLYYSVVSFTAVGYGNWAPQPTGWAKGMGAAEAVIGVFMMALFLVTFTRKMTR